MAKVSARKKNRAAPGRRPADKATGNIEPGLIPGLLLIIAATLWSLWPSLHGGWLMDWDDNIIVVDNRDLRSFAGLWKIWISSPGFDYWPLTQTFLWLEWHLFGSQALGFRLANLALHVCSSVLVWRLLARLGLRWGLLGGVLFAIHPLSVESVAWISEVKNALSLPFFLLAVLSYLAFDRDEDSASYIKSILFYIAAMLSKTSVIMLPMILLLYCWWKRGTVRALDFKRILPFFLVALILGLVTVAFQAPTPITVLAATRTPWEIWLTAGQEIYFYLGCFLVPVKLILIYPRWTLTHPTQLQLALWPILFALLVLAYLQKTWGRHVLLGLGFFLLTLLQVLGFVHFTYMKYSWVADHFVYLPIVGLVGLVTSGTEYLHALLPATYRRLVVGVAVGVLIVLTFETRNYAGYFADEKALWEITLARNPEALPAYHNLGMVYSNMGNTDQAADCFRRAIQIEPRFPEAHYDLGIVMLEMGNPAAATEEFDETERISPHYPPAYYGKGTLYLQEDRIPEALAQLQMAVQLSPHDVDAQDNLGYALQRSGQPEAALVHYHAALDENPDYAPTHYNLGTALMDLKRFDDAAREFSIALRLDPSMIAAQKQIQEAQQRAAGLPAHN